MMIFHDIWWFFVTFDDYRCFFMIKTGDLSWLIMVYHDWSWQITTQLGEVSMPTCFHGFRPNLCSFDSPVWLDLDHVTCSSHVIIHRPCDLLVMWSFKGHVTCSSHVIMHRSCDLLQSCDHAPVMWSCSSHVIMLQSCDHSTVMWPAPVMWSCSSHPTRSSRV